MGQVAFELMCCRLAGFQQRTWGVGVGRWAACSGRKRNRGCGVRLVWGGAVGDEGRSLMPAVRSQPWHSRRVRDRGLHDREGTQECAGREVSFQAPPAPTAPGSSVPTGGHVSLPSADAILGCGTCQRRGGPGLGPHLLQGF